MAQSTLLATVRDAVEPENANKSTKGTPAPGPYTPPARFISSNYSSPGSTFGKEEDAIIIELNPRSLEAGIEGESCPQCIIGFKPDRFRRVGDFRTWLPQYKKPQESLDNWGHDYELWRNDLKDFDPGLLEDKLERVIRDVYNKHLLVDAGNARLILVLPSLVPHPVLSSILSTFFGRWNFPSIALLPSPTTTAVAAGLRSALIVDIGWEETTITSIYDYRETSSFRTTRAMKLLTRFMMTCLGLIKAAHEQGENLVLDLEFVEEVIGKLSDSIIQSTNCDDTKTVADRDIMLDWPTSSTSISIPLKCADIIDEFHRTFFTEIDASSDDHEIPLDRLIHKALKSLPPDVRGLCISRIVFTGQGSQLKFITSEAIHKLQDLVTTVGWMSTQHKGLKDYRKESTEKADAKHDKPFNAGKDYIEELVRKEKAKVTHPLVPAQIRQIESLGPWTGASLLTTLKIKGLVEIERNQFSSYGLSGASREGEVTMLPQTSRLSNFGIARGMKGTEKNGWTLGGWG